MFAFSGDRVGRLAGFITLLIYILNNPFAPGLGAGDSAFTAAFPSG